MTAAFVRAFLAFFAFNLALRAAALRDLFFLNEDAALAVGARQMFASSPLALLRPLAEPYGPGFLRPWQLWGFYFEQGHLGLSAPASVVVGLAIFSLALAVAFAALRPHVGSLGAAVGCLLASGTPLTGEPLLWLSDRHDVYLAFFFAFALACAFGVVARSLELRRGLGLLTVALWGAFYSNEKGTAVPVVVCLGALALVVARAELGREWKRVLGLGAVALANVVAYFALRRAVLGKLIGGYDDRLLTGDGLGSEALGRLLGNVLTLSLFSQNEPSPLLGEVLLAALGAALFVLGAWGARHRARLGRAVAAGALLYAALLASAVPTLRHFVSEPLGFRALGALGAGNLRNLWLPHLVANLLFGALLGLVFVQLRGKLFRGVAVAVAGVLIAGHAYQAVDAAARFARAGRLTREVVSVMRASCACADVRSGQVTGVPSLYAGVNTLTEPPWLDFQLELGGVRRCSEDEPRCAIAVYVSNVHEPTVAARASTRSAP